MYSINLFSLRLKQFRKAKQRSNGKPFRQIDLADELGVTLDTVKSWEQARVWPSTDNLLKLSDLFGCDLDYFIGNIDEKTHDKQFIRDYTGLNDSAIDSLSKLNKAVSTVGFDIPQLLSILLNYNGFLAVLIRLYQLKSFTDGLRTGKVLYWQRIAESPATLAEIEQVTDDMADTLDRIGNIKYQIEREMDKVFSAFSYDEMTGQPIYNWIDKTRMDLLEKGGQS